MNFFHFLFFISFVNCEISINLPTPAFDSSVSRIYDPAQLQSEPAYILLNGFLKGEIFQLVVIFDNIANSTTQFSGSDVEIDVTVPFPRFADGPHSITAMVFDNVGATVVKTGVELEVRAGWNNGNLRDGVCSLCEFTTNWIHDHVSTWENVLSGFMLPAKAHWSEAQNASGFDVLEIGSWEGRSAIWFARRLFVRSLTCVDTWAGGEDHATHLWRNVLPAIERRFDHNLQAAGLGPDIELIKRAGSSYQVLPELLADGHRFDLVYVDGSHTSHAVAFDLVLALHLLRPGGLALLDDYRYSDGVRAAADAIVAAHTLPAAAATGGAIVEVEHADRQLAVRKLRDIAAFNWA